MCGLFEIKQGPDGSPMYQNNAFSAVLSDRHPNSVRAAAVHFNWDCWRWVTLGDSASLSTSAVALAHAKLWKVMLLIAVEADCSAYKPRYTMQQDSDCQVMTLVPLHSPAAGPGVAMLMWFGPEPTSLLRRMEA